MRVWNLFEVVLLAAVLLFAGCVPMNAGGSRVIGTLRISGPNVWLNGNPGREGDQFLSGSSLATGPGSSAIVDFQGGGFLQLDENTDPFFEWLAQSKCILIRIIKGQAYLKREKACVEGPNLNLVLNSEANLRMAPEPPLAEVTLLKGSADVTVPEPIRLLPGQQLTAYGRGVASLRVLSAPELRSAVAWRQIYRFAVPAREPEPVLIPVPDSRDRRRDRREKSDRDGRQQPPSPSQTAPVPPSAPSVERGLRFPRGIVTPQPDIR